MKFYDQIFWDFDGTLFDTYPAIAQAFQDILREELALSVEYDEIYDRMKVTVRDALNYYRELYDISDSMIERFEARRIVLEEKSNPYEGVAELLSSLKHRGVKHYLYTHRDLSAKRMLTKHSLSQYFDLMITAEDGFPFKPSPEALLAIMKRYDMAKEESLMVGDREIDVKAAVNAGIDSCLISASPSAKASEADFVVPDMEALSRLLLLSSSG